MKKILFNTISFYTVGLLIVLLTTFEFKQIPIENNLEISSSFNKSNLLNTISVEAESTYKYPLPLDLIVEYKDFPNFINIVDKQILITPAKYDLGEYTIYLNAYDYIKLNIYLNPIASDELKINILNMLGNESTNYGIYIYDLKRNVEISFNESNLFRAASMVKVPIAIAILKEVEDGNLSLDSYYNLKENLIFTNLVGLGQSSIGTPFTVRQYLEAMIIESDNTALNHLDAILSEKYGNNLNMHLKELLGVNFFVNPPETTPKEVGTVLEGLYNYRFLNKTNSDYLINLLMNAVPDLKEGIGLGIPSNIQFANKIGFLDTNEDLSYMDSAIVYGTKTDYIVVVMNKNQPWTVARDNLKNLSSIIYKYLN